MSDLRPAVDGFARAMERKLRLNDHKAHWGDSTIDHLFTRLLDEVAELSHAMQDGGAIGDECADVANFAMMIFDHTAGSP